MNELDYEKHIGFYSSDEASEADRAALVEFVKLKLAAKGVHVEDGQEEPPLLRMAEALLTQQEERTRLAGDYFSPTDAHIQQFLDSYLSDVSEPGERWIPETSFELERHGVARTISVPLNADKFESDIISSYRVEQGVLHNPIHDRRTTKGSFHVAEGGFPIPADKIAVPKKAFAELLRIALRPPESLLEIPFTHGMKETANSFVSLLLRPMVCPEVHNISPKKTMEVRFFAPGNLVSNLDFVESIFGNAGNPYLPENDARLDVEHWSGHTGYVLLAPHLTKVKKKDLGLPHISEATERQIRDGVCWEDEDELYNNGSAFKITCRDHRGVICTLIADNYFGYCKKEIKTQLSYATNLMGMAEEEHAGGALAFPSIDYGESFEITEYQKMTDHTFEEVSQQFADIMHLQPEGYGVDKKYSDIYYIPLRVSIDLRSQTISWKKDGTRQQIPIRPGITYFMPNGQKLEMVKPEHATRWRVVMTYAEGTYCHKPCTVSGGGKSEISKPITDAMISGPVFVKNFEADFDQVEEIVTKDFGKRYKNPKDPNASSRPFLSPERSFGSAVKMLSVNPEFTPEYNAWVAAIPQTVRDLTFTVKRFYKPHWGDHWRERFSVDNINGWPGHELKYRDTKLISSFIRVGFNEDGSWRTFSLRKDFVAAKKLQQEDDISASMVIPKDQVDHLHSSFTTRSVKFTRNCEYRLFQRPDEAIHRGYDKKTELDFSRHDMFFSNYHPTTLEEAEAIKRDTIGFEKFTEPMRETISRYVTKKPTDYMVCTANPRIVDGKPTKNPRYLQNRPDLEDPRSFYIGEMGARLNRKVPLSHPVHFPVNAVLPGRRNNPPDPEAGIRALAPFNPIHYQELPELFMDFIASLTGKSPSTTGAGSEGALTKGPFNALPPIIDLNGALVSYLLTEAPAFTSAAGYVGPKCRVDHDVSLLIPDIWSRMYVYERDPQWLIENECLEKIDDFEHKGQKVFASRLGYRINKKFVSLFFGRMFSDPTTVFTEEMLKPELQDMNLYVDAINNIVETMQRVAQNYFDDGSIEYACPPLKALLHIMAYGDFEGKDAHHPEFRAMFTREALIQSDWYQQRLDSKVAAEIRELQERVSYLKTFKETNPKKADSLCVEERIKKAEQRLAYVQTTDYRESLVGTLGTDPRVLHA